MSTARQIDSRKKPLPALPTEKLNLDDSTKSLPSSPSPPTTPVQDSSDLQLDSVSLGHVRKILRQSLHNCEISTDPWETVILGIILDISEIIPKAIEFLKDNKKIDEKINEINNDNDNNNDNVSNNDKDNNNDTIDYNIKNEQKFIINLKKEENGNPTDSHFVYNFFDGEYLFKYEDYEDSKSTKDEMKRWIGGTIILNGFGEYINGIDKILELMVHVVCNLRLEMCLFRDNSVLRVDTKDGQDAEDIQNTLRNSRRSSKSSWLGWLIHNDMSNIKEHIKSSYGKDEKREKREKNEKSELYKLLTRRLPLKKQNLKSDTASTTTTSTTDEEDDVINFNTNEFACVIHQMERIILSSSPGVKFPPPHLLMRLSEEETEIRLHTNSDGTFKSFIARDALDLASEFSNGNSSNNSMGKYRTYAAISKSNQVSLDFRSGLTYLMINNNSLNGVFKHQSLSCSYSRFWSPTSILPCDNHKTITFEYYDKSNDHTDKSLGEMISFLCDQAYEICRDSSCDHPGIDHIITYTHNTGRISIILEESSSDSKIKIHNTILMWTECKICRKKTKVVQMSHATWLYSFGKYLELLFYNEDFFCKNLCQHVESRDFIVRCFRKDKLIVKIEYEHVSLFEMRLPKLQISQDETPVFSTLSEDDGIDKLFVIDTEDSNRLKFDETRLEITYFYGSVKQHITALEEYFDSLPLNERFSNEKNSNEKVSPDEGKDYLDMLNDMTKEFREEEFELYKILEKLKATTLNDIRKLLVEKIFLTKKRLLDWQKKHVLEKDLEKFSNIDWVEPEYASSSNCHVFPGSPIIIREDEPSSIIAFTISSRDYLRELSLMRQNIRLSFSQSAPVTPTSEPYKPPQASNSFSTLMSFKSSTDINSENDLDQYSSNIRRKYVKEAQSGLGEKIISYGIESLAFNLSLSGKDKKKDPGKDGEKQISKGGGSFAGIFGQKNEDTEKPKNGDTDNEQQEVFNEKMQNGNEDKKSSDSEKLPTEKQQQNEKESLKRSDSSNSNTFALWRKPQKSGKDSKDSPHLKYKCTHGKKTFSCTVYYATQFDSLRRRCGIENICIDSLSRCSSWQATGGKSSSTFFKTKDERLVVKQVVSSWKVGEKEALLRFAPKYFEYMYKPSKPSVLAKIFGFYTIKIKDTKKNNVIMKMDVLVMEHLFFDKTITRKFDLKGIQERHVKSRTQEGDATLWDGDWVEGRYKSLLLIHSHSKKIIREAILNDTKFLADSNIMDYSLLVGVDDEKKELVAGIVDFIGAYTLYKRIENKGKTIGRNAKEVTVLPPDQYKDRFRDSIDQYFLAVPDKWIKSPNTDDTLSSIAEEQLSPLFSDSQLSPKSTNSIQLHSVL